MSKSEEKEKTNYYISPKQFGLDVKVYYDLSEQVEKYTGDKETKEYKQLLRQQKRALDKCGIYLQKMVIGLSNNGKFSGYTWKDEMIADALIQCSKALVGRKYDFSKGSNVFSYYNRVAWREFIHRIKIEKKKVETQNKFIEEHAQDYSKDSDTPIYIRPNFAASLGSFYDEEMEVEKTYNDIDER